MLKRYEELFLPQFMRTIVSRREIALNIIFFISKTSTDALTFANIS